MDRQATPIEIGQIAAYVQSQFDHVETYSYGEEPEMQVDFHIPCEEGNTLMADTLAALVPCLSRQHSASAFQAGEFVQLSLHKEPSTELAEAFFHEAIGRAASDNELAQKIAQQIELNRREQAKRAEERAKRIAALKKRNPQPVH